MCWHPEENDTGFWALTKHADVKAVSHDSATFSSELGGTFIPTADEEALANLRLTILMMDPPKHHRYRRLVSKGFTPRMITQLVEDIERRSAAVIDEVCEKGEAEFVEEIAAQVPVQIICQMIGLEPEVWPRMITLSNNLIGARDDPDYQEIAGGPEAASMEVYMMCDAVAADRRQNPRDDIMSALVHAEIDGERLSDPELNLFFITLIVAGNETTRNLINHSMLALLDHPDEAERLRKDPSLWDTRRGGDAPLGRVDPQLPPHRHPRHRDPRRADRGGRQGRHVLRGRQPRRRGVRRPARLRRGAARPTTT